MNYFDCSMINMLAEQSSINQKEVYQKCRKTKKNKQSLDFLFMASMSGILSIITTITLVLYINTKYMTSNKWWLYITIVSFIIMCRFMYNTFQAMHNGYYSTKEYLVLIDEFCRFFVIRWKDILYIKYDGFKHGYEFYVRDSDSLICRLSAKNKYIKELLTVTNGNKIPLKGMPDKNLFYVYHISKLDKYIDNLLFIILTLSIPGAFIIHNYCIYIMLASLMLAAMIKGVMIEDENNVILINGNKIECYDTAGVKRTIHLTDIDSTFVERDTLYANNECTGILFTCHKSYVNYDTLCDYLKKRGHLK